MCRLLSVLIFLLFLLVGIPVSSNGLSSSGPLRLIPKSGLTSILPVDARLMVKPETIEEFLIALDGQPPDWRALYGNGHGDSGLDDRLFALNRERDAKRAGRPPLSWLVSFLWVGELSRYDSERGGFPVALGPKFIKTRWGVIRFKPEETPGNLLVALDAVQREQYQRELGKNQTFEIDVVMTGRLVPEESLVYDFSHDEEGLGLIMPFVRVERIDLVLPP